MRILSNTSVKLVFSSLLAGLLITGSAEMFADDTTSSQTMTQTQAQAQINQCLTLMQQRLEFMHQVAQAKWNQKLPAVNKNDDQKLLDDLANAGTQAGLDESWTRNFFQAQIDACNLVQTSDLANWTQAQQPRFKKVINLKKDVANYVNKIDSHLISILSDTYNDGLQLDFTQPIFTGSGGQVEPGAWLIATMPLNWAVKHIEGASNNTSSSKDKSKKSKGKK